MSLNDAVWGWCFGCNRDVEVRMGVLIRHGREVRCVGSGTAPRTPPREGSWRPPVEPVKPVPPPVRSEPGPVDDDTAAQPEDTGAPPPPPAQPEPEPVEEEAGPVPAAVPVRPAGTLRTFLRYLIRDTGT